MLSIKRYGVITVLAATMIVPAPAAAQVQDLRNPDRRAPVAQTQDLRNADRRAPVTAGPAAPQAPAVTTIELPGEGFDWGDAGIGAAGAIAIVAMVAGAVLAGTSRRRPRAVA